MSGITSRCCMTMTAIISTIFYMCRCYLRRCATSPHLRNFACSYYDVVTHLAHCTPTHCPMDNQRVVSRDAFGSSRFRQRHDRVCTLVSPCSRSNERYSWVIPRRCAGVPLCRCTAVPVYRFTGVLVYRCAGVPACVFVFKR